jgi:hypothetical protein
LTPDETGGYDYETGCGQIMKIWIILRILFHGIGLSCLASAVFLGLLVFYNVGITGVFYGIEVNRVISSIEFFCMFYAAAYLMFLTRHTILSYMKRD